VQKWELFSIPPNFVANLSQIFFHDFDFFFYQAIKLINELVDSDSFEEMSVIHPPAIL